MKGPKTPVKKLENITEKPSPLVSVEKIPFFVTSSGSLPFSPTTSTMYIPTKDPPASIEVSSSVHTTIVAINRIPASGPELATAVSRHSTSTVAPTDISATARVTPVIAPASVPVSVPAWRRQKPSMIIPDQQPAPIRQAAPAVCHTCGCSQFVANRFKPGYCADCSHSHKA